jgi:hypothetical protein
LNPFSGGETVSVFPSGNVNFAQHSYNKENGRGKTGERQNRHNMTF